LGEGDIHGVLRRVGIRASLRLGPGEQTLLDDSVDAPVAVDDLSDAKIDRD
jgi:hypothetical protein